MITIGDRQYYYSQICLNGHVLTDIIEDPPDTDTEFCEECGEEIISKCKKCGNYIRGSLYIHNVTIAAPPMAPSYCYSCGNPLPWLESKINALQELIDFEDKLSKEQKETLNKNINDIINETPRTKVASMKIKAVLKVMRKETAHAARDIFVDIASTTAKKILLGE